MSCGDDPGWMFKVQGFPALRLCCALASLNVMGWFRAKKNQALATRTVHKSVTTRERTAIKNKPNKQITLETCYL
jgi:hypothetical protein